MSSVPIIYEKSRAKRDETKSEGKRPTDYRDGECTPHGVISVLVYLSCARAHTHTYDRGLWPSRTCSGQGPCTRRRYTSDIIRSSPGVERNNGLVEARVSPARLSIGTSGFFPFFSLSFSFFFLFISSTRQPLCAR